jgi:GNAT superfamily N-acetyltransferase
VTIQLAGSDDEIAATFDVMKQLRAHLAREQYVEQVRRLMREHGFHLAALSDGGAVQAVAGYRYGESLAWGRHLYVDDLVTAETARSRQYGKQLMAWLLDEARSKGCVSFHLDSGVQRHAAHRFYLRERMDIMAYHFQMPVTR